MMFLGISQKLETSTGKKSTTSLQAQVCIMLLEGVNLVMSLSQEKFVIEMCVDHVWATQPLQLD